MEQSYESQRIKMVDEQLITRGIKSTAVLDAMRTVPRHLFVSKHLQDYAYSDSPLPIGMEQTISQPYIVAYMTEFIEPSSDMKILEIGTGSGYQTAVLAYFGCKVYSIEYIKELAYQAMDKLVDYDNVKVRYGNGYEGWQEEAPFDAIIITAAPERIPEKLIEQLKNSGKMIVPVGGQYSAQWLKLITKTDGRISVKELLPVRFVPMVE